MIKENILLIIIKVLSAVAGASLGLVYKKVGKDTKSFASSVVISLVYSPLYIKKFNIEDTEYLIATYVTVGALGFMLATIVFDFLGGIQKAIKDIDFKNHIENFINKFNKK